MPARKGSQETDEAIYQIRNLRYIAEALRAETKGMKIMDGRNAKGRIIKEALEDANVHACVVRDRLTTVLRQLGDEPVEGDML